MAYTQKSSDPSSSQKTCIVWDNVRVGVGIAGALAVTSGTAMITNQALSNKDAALLNESVSLYVPKYLIGLALLVGGWIALLWAILIRRKPVLSSDGIPTGQYTYDLVKHAEKHKGQTALVVLSVAMILGAAIAGYHETSHAPGSRDEDHLKRWSRVIMALGVLGVLGLTISVSQILRYTSDKTDSTKEKWMRIGGAATAGLATVAGFGLIYSSKRPAKGEMDGRRIGGYILTGAGLMGLAAMSTVSYRCPGVY